MVFLIRTNYSATISEEMILKPNTLLKLILDPSWFRNDIGSIGLGMPNIISENDANTLECIGRTFCYQLYQRRFQILSEEDTDSETEDDQDAYSVHDTSDSSSTESDWDDSD